MGEHDQTVQHDKDAHEDIGDDGRKFHPIDVGDRFFQGAGGGANDPAYNNPDPYLDPDLYKFTQVFRFFHDTVTPDSVLVHTRPFSVTRWESLYSSLFGTGVRGDVIPWFDGKDLEVEPSFTPVIDEGYRVVGHLGWIDIGQICMRKFTDAKGTGTAFHLEKARLAAERRQILWRNDHPYEAFPFPGQRARDSWESQYIASLRKGPLKDGSEEQRHQKNLNFFLKAGGKALVGRELAKALLESERYSLYEYTGYRCFALVSPDGHLQAVLAVEKIPYVSFNERSMRPVFKAIDIALTVLMIIDIATISVALVRLGTLVIRALEVAIDEAAKAALEAAAAKAAKEFAVEEIEVDAQAQARWEARGARLHLEEPGDTTVVVGELWPEGAAQPTKFSGESGRKAARLTEPKLPEPPKAKGSKPKTAGPKPAEVTPTEAEPITHVMKPTPIEGYNKGIPDHLPDLSPAEKRKWLNSPEGREWQQTQRLDGPNSPHPGARDHDAEAHMFKRLEELTKSDTAGEFHFMADHPMCPACKNLTFRFTNTRPKIKVIQHVPDNKFTRPR